MCDENILKDLNSIDVISYSKTASLLKAPKYANKSKTDVKHYTESEIKHWEHSQPQQPKCHAFAVVLGLSGLTTVSLQSSGQTTQVRNGHVTRSLLEQLHTP